MITLRTHQGTRYTPTADDVLWLSRAVEAEGAPHELVAQTLVNGFLWAREALGSKRTLAQWVQAYAQPVSPLWMPGGERYEQQLAAADTDAERAAVRAAGWRRKTEHATRNTFGGNTRRAVERALSGPPRYAGAVDYAAWWLEHAPPWIAHTPAKRGTNRLWTRPGAAGWTGYDVEGALTAPGKKAWGLWLGILGTLGYMLWKAKA